MKTCRAAACYFLHSVSKHNSLRIRHCSNMEAKELGKQTAARTAVDDFVKDNMAVGIGSGSTIVYAVKRIAERVKSENLTLTCVPTSYQAQQLILEHDLRLGSLETNPKLDVALDGADEVDKDLICIKGGGGCLMQEKIVASAAETFVLIADISKKSEVLGTSWKKGVPIEVLPMAYRPVKLKIESHFGGVADLRIATSKAGPTVTDNGNFILDWKFPAVVPWEECNTSLCLIPGVLETGLFVKMAKLAYFGKKDGTLEKMKAA